MKALILAAGFGSRLLPHTKRVPKPLFPVNGTPVINSIIIGLQKAGFSKIFINTHHLHKQIETFILNQKYNIEVYTTYEESILGTGGAVRNLAEFLDDPGQPFMVINSDIVTDIDFRAVYNFHSCHTYPATMVLYDYPGLNRVSVNNDEFILSFYPDRVKDSRILTFTGIHVIDPKIFDFIPDKPFSNIIEAYISMIERGEKIKAFIASDKSWIDIGTEKRYQKAVFKSIAEKAFKKAFKSISSKKIKKEKLQGDGSDRIWTRLSKGRQSLIMADHGICADNSVCEFDSFIKIGRHLLNKGINVPEIYIADRFSGLVFLQDLGDVHLQDIILAGPEYKIAEVYKKVINMLICMSIFGYRDFDPLWTFQTRGYDKNFIMEYECRYFVESFLNGYCRDMRVCFEDFKAEFRGIADMAIENSITGLMHRDLQSRNIMVNYGQPIRSMKKYRYSKDLNFYFIDFQGARQGPIQYDLASLLIDPYVNLPVDIQEGLVDYCESELARFISFDKEKFRQGFKYCSLTRNFQILGAFGFLTRIKGKKSFEKYIQPAINTLKRNLPPEFSDLSAYLKPFYPWPV